MATEKQLFSNFEPNTKKDWLAKITKDLKGRSIEELNWQLENNISISPVYTFEDLTDSSPPITLGKNSNNWQIGEYIISSDMGQANAIALEGLMGGVNAPLFRLRHLPSTEELSILLNDIEPEFISVHFEPQHVGKDPAELFRNLIYYTRKRGLKLSSIAGSMDFDPLLDWTNAPFKPLSRILAFAHQYTPHFKVLQVNGRVFHTNISNTSLELALILSKGTEYLAQMDQLGISPEQTNRHLQFSIAISSSYFVEIAKIRALRILWANILDGYKLKGAKLPPILAHLSPESQTKDPQTNMIKASSQAMAAAIGGADIIFIPPSDQQQSAASSSFSRRISRNVQHLLQMESHLDRVVDPASGSYYIESLTKALCEEAWAQFQVYEKEGGFMNIGDLG